jgi:hypothetical protein
LKSPYSALLLAWASRFGSESTNEMSCNECETQQELRGPTIRLLQIFVRVGNGNVEIVACDKHAKELIERLRNAP